MQIDAPPCFAGDGGADDVADGGDGGAFVQRLPDGRQRVGGLAGLADGNHERAGIDDGIPVAELRRLLDFGGNAGDVLEIVFANHAGVHAGAAGGDDDARNLRHFVRRHVQPRELCAAHFGIESAMDGIGQDLRLLVDLLEHEMLVFALAGDIHAPVNLLDGRL